MKLSLSDNSQAYVISAYEKGQFTVKGQVYTGSQVIRPGRPPETWTLQTIPTLTRENFSALLDEDVETVIIGSGERLIFPDEQYLQLFYARAIGIEIMDTAAACRTYNILVAEGRKVVAGLIPL